MTGGSTKNFIGGQFVESKADKWLEVHDPVSCFLFDDHCGQLTRLILVYPNRAIESSPDHQC